MRTVANHALALTGTAAGGAVTGYLITGKSEGALRGAAVHLAILGIIAGFTGAASGVNGSSTLRGLYFLGGSALLGWIGYDLATRR